MPAPLGSPPTAGRIRRSGSSTAPSSSSRHAGSTASSYADVAGELRITKASLHYHFQSKAELGEALIARYARRFTEALEELDRDAAGAPEKLAGYAELYADVVRGHRMCLCGMLAAEYQTLPRSIRVRVVAFFDENEHWLARVLDQGRSDHTLRFEGSARDSARVIISSFEGAMLVARPCSDLRQFQSTANTLLAGLVARDSAQETVRGGSAT